MDVSYPNFNAVAEPLIEFGVVEPVQDGSAPFDFEQSTVLPADQMRSLRLRQEEFARALGDRLSLHLRLECAFKLSEIQTIPCQRFIKALPNPMHLAQFRLEPMRGICYLEMAPSLGLSLVDRLLGGNALLVNQERELTEIEISLLEQVTSIMLDECCKQWRDLHDLKPVLLGHESNPRFLQVSPMAGTLLVTVFEVTFGGLSTAIKFAFPLQAFEPLIKRLNPPIEAEPAPTAPRPALRWNSTLDEVTVSIAAGWEALEMTAREITRLTAGDVLLLSPACAGGVRLRVAGKPKFIGRLGTRGGQWAVEIGKPGQH